MKLNLLKPKKAFLKVKPNRTEIEGFKTNLILCSTGQMTRKAKSFIKTLV
jgi:adenine-specific DNA-methyltransferase